MARDGFLLEGRNWRNSLCGNFDIRGAKNGLGFAKTIFWGKDFAKPRLICFGGNSDLVSARRRGLGRNPRGFSFLILAGRAMD